MNHYADALSAHEIDRGEPEPQDDVCIDCHSPIPVGFLRCADCDENHERLNDPREQPTGTAVPRR